MTRVLDYDVVWTLKLLIRARQYKIATVLQFACQTFSYLVALYSSPLKQVLFLFPPASFSHGTWRNGQ